MLARSLHRAGSSLRRTGLGARLDRPLLAIEPLWNRLLDRLAPRGYPVLVNGDQVRLTYAYGVRYARDGYEPLVHRELAALLSEGMVFVDVGAHVGLHALAAGLRVGPAGRVFAFEPSPPTADLLERHVAFNGLRDRVEVLRTVVSDSVGTAQFFINEETMAASVDDRNFELAPQAFRAPHRRIECPTTTLDAFCAERRVTPSVIKIDVEGAELAVLRGARELLATDLTVICEVHPAQLAVAGGSAEELEELVADAGRTWDLLGLANDQGIFHALILPR